MDQVMSNVWVFAACVRVTGCLSRARHPNLTIPGIHDLTSCLDELLIAGRRGLSLRRIDKGLMLRQRGRVSVTIASVAVMAAVLGCGVPIVTAAPVAVAIVSFCFDPVPNDSMHGESALH